MIETKYLKDNLKNVDQLAAIPVFKDMETKKLASLLKVSKIRQYEAGEAIIKKGEDDPWIYFLLQGGVVVRNKGYVIARIDTPGHIFGEMRLTDGGDRSASVFAEKKTICLAVNLDAEDRLGSESEKVLLQEMLFTIITKNLSLRLRSVNEKFIEIKDNLEFSAGFEDDDDSSDDMFWVAG
ncbi:MAG: cyclic nucleotide-binding domain-containing protein [Desulfobacterales bacterium]